MSQLTLHKYGIPASTLALGCMGFGGQDWFDKGPVTAAEVKQGEAAVDAALSVGINMFDHANIYKSGKAEKVFGEYLKAHKDMRDRMIIQSKCGIVFPDDNVDYTRFNFSKENILRTVDGSLERLRTDYLDILLLHRPDPLMDPEEVADAFNVLHNMGKVRWFGVSNMSAAQMRLLQKSLDQPIVANQLELSLYKNSFVNTVVNINQENIKSDVFPEGTLEYCRLEDVQIQSWGPLARGRFSGANIENESAIVKATADKVAQYAKEKGTSREAIVVAWLLKHPAHIQPIIGTTDPDRIKACDEGTRTELTRDEWYSLFISARGQKMP